MMQFRKSVIAIVLCLALVIPGAALAAEMDMMDTEMKDMDMTDAYMGVSTMAKSGMEYVELRQLAKNLGYVIEWNSMTKAVTLTTAVKDDMMMDKMSKYVIKLTVGDMSIMVNGEKQDTSMIVSGRTFVTKTFADMYLVQMMK